MRDADAVLKEGVVTAACDDSGVRERRRVVVETKEARAAGADMSLRGGGQNLGHRAGRGRGAYHRRGAERCW